MHGLAFCPPPDKISVNGTEYKINTDYRVWLKVLKLMNDLDFSVADEDSFKNGLKILIEIITAVFGEIINEPADAVINAIKTFMTGYPEEKKSEDAISSSDNEQVVSFEHDINLILLAIRNQSGIDLTYRRKEPFHWWEFLLEFRSLEEHHLICKIMSYRAYNGNDPERLKLKLHYSLPARKTKAEEKELEEFSQLFN